MDVFKNKFLWVLDSDTCGGVDNIIAVAQATGLGICAKWHDGDPSDDTKWQFSRKFTEIASKALPLNIPLLAWGYCYGDTHGNLLKEADAVADVLTRYPSIGYVIDAEIEWEQAKGADWAKTFGERVLAKVPDAKSRLAYCPFWNMRWHALYPAKVFSQYCSAVMPQTYFGLGKKTTRESRDEMVRIALEDFAPYGLPIYPIAEFSAGVGGVVDFIDIAQKSGIGSYSWWLLDKFQDGPEIAYLKGLVPASQDYDARIAALESEMRRVTGLMDKLKQAFSEEGVS